MYELWLFFEIFFSIFVLIEKDCIFAILKLYCISFEIIFYNILNDGGKRVSGHLSFQLLFLFFILFVSSFYTSVQGITPGKLISHQQSIPEVLQEANALVGHPSTDSVNASVYKIAEEPDDAPLDTINFKLCFDILAKNRLTYNHYNDSIFLIKEHDKWVNYFRRRAIKIIRSMLPIRKSCEESGIFLPSMGIPFQKKSILIFVIP